MHDSHINQVGFRYGIKHPKVSNTLRWYAGSTAIESSKEGDYARIMILKHQQKGLVSQS